MEFKELGINEEIVKKLKENGIEKPSPVQVKTLPYTLSGRDVVVQAETGSGKTLCFALPIVQKVLPEGVQALVITPTRELAKQVGAEFEKFGEKGKTAVVYGGVSIERQFDEIRHANVVVGTPGRLLDILSRKRLNLGKVKFLVSLCVEGD